MCWQNFFKDCRCGIWPEATVAPPDAHVALACAAGATHLQGHFFPALMTLTGVPTASGMQLS